jgi:hypothetical protein
MLLEGLLFLPIIDSALKAQLHTFAAYIFTTSIVILAVVGITSVFKRKLVRPYFLYYLLKLLFLTQSKST